MSGIFRQRYSARFATTKADIAGAQALRGLCFRGDDTLEDRDDFDDICAHVLVEDSRLNNRLVSTFRILPFDDGSKVSQSYAAQYSELSGLAAYPGKMVEMGRFCVAPGLNDPDIFRVAWQAMAEYVLEHKFELLFGCSSFKGVESAHYHDAFAFLAASHLAPRPWLPRVKSPLVFRFARRLRLFTPNRARALRVMPPLLRTYLGMGGWVSDHAVVDRDLNTMHVFTGLEINRIPQQRRRVLGA